MTSLPTAHAPSAEGLPDALLVREGGVPYAPSNTRDALQAWVELMEVVESLCARWPQRASSLKSGSFLL